MKINRNDLIKAFNVVKGAVGKNNLGGARTDYLIKDNYLTATNGEVIARTKIDSNYESMVLPGKIETMIKGYDDEYISIGYINGNIVITTGRTKTSIKTDDVSTYVLPDVQQLNTEKVVINASGLNRAISKIMYAVAKDGVKKPVLEGMNLKCDNGYINYAASDGYRVAWVKTESDSNKYWEVNIPKGALDVLRKAELKNDIDVTYNSSWITFDDKNTIISVRLLDGEYIKYENVFTRGDTNYKVNKKSLMDALNRVKMISDMNVKCVHLKFSNIGIYISIKEALASYDEVITANESNSDKDIDIFFNGNYLIDAVKEFGEDLDIWISGSKAPLIITDENYQALLLPVDPKMVRV